MKRKALCCCLALVFSGLARPFAAGAPARSGPAAIHADRWLEIDLYWFDRDQIEKSAGAFWDRFDPLFRGVDGWRGAILNVGWTASYILDWRGRLGDRVPLPADMQEANWFKVAGMLKGTTDERLRQWAERFRDPAAHLKRAYQPWTYGDVKALAEALRRTADRRGVRGFKVGSFVLGWGKIYGGKDFPFAIRHPNLFLHGVYGEGVFDPRVRLGRDPTPYGAYPHGISPGLPVTEFFGRQWGSLSRSLGLDALVLRDSMIGPVPYRRVGPYGSTASPDPAQNARWTEATAALVRSTKQANPQALVIGYSTAASAVGGWRIGDVDLESIAKEGYLDAWIDQTWAGAWNEVGVRQDNFWNDPVLGWTYQLAYVLVHAAQLADTKTRHYVLTETFDAWESWDTIHTAPQRLRWAIWAYLHAAVKTPRGLKMPQGSYISWANQGSRLLSPEDVAFLSRETDGALADARRTTDVRGPTLVYNRPALLWQQQHAPNVLMSEWIDEQAGALLKWGVPILSITRTEYLPRVDSDLLIVQTPVHLPPETLRALEQRVAGGEPLALFGSLSTGVDPRLAKLAGVSGGGVKPGTGRPATGVLGGGAAGALGAGVPASFALYQPALRNEAAPGTKVVYSVDGSPALTIGGGNAGKVLFWDPADLFCPLYPAMNRRPLAAAMGSVYPFVLAARAVSGLLAGTESPRVEPPIDAATPATLLAWQTAEGTWNILAADLEEGLSDAARSPYALRVRLPAGAPGETARVLEIPLSQGASELYRLRRDR